VIVRWHHVGNLYQIAVDWRDSSCDGAAQLRSAYVVESDCGDTYLAHVDGPPLGDADHDALAADVRAEAAEDGTENDAPYCPARYYAGIL